MRNRWTFTDGTSMPVGTMYCIGRNYAAHAQEMNASVNEKPLVFLKPPAAYVSNDSEIVLPTWSENIHHEVEMVVVIGQSDMNGPDANRHVHRVSIAGIGVGLDLTARDVQAIAKKRGEPWAVAKGWKGSAPVSDIVPASVAGAGPWEIDLSVNGSLRQHASTSEMEHSVDELVAYIDSIFTLQEGDCIFTGTPEGVARCVAGDVAVARIGYGPTNVLASLTLSFA